MIKGRPDSTQPLNNEESNVVEEETTHSSSISSDRINSSLTVLTACAISQTCGGGGCLFQHVSLLFLRERTCQESDRK